MPELIERGHIYIAQPPLYKVKYQKSEKYLKDDEELENHVFELAVKNSKLILEKDMKKDEISIVDDVKTLANNVIKAKRKIKTLSSVIDVEILESVLDGVEFNFSSETDIQNSVNVFNKWQEKNEITNLNLGIKFLNDKERWSLTISKTNHGNIKTNTIDEKFFIGDDYSFLNELSKQLKIYFGFKIKVQISKESDLKKANSFADAIDILMIDTGKKLIKQRYKGLGEMNPEQLWETTMDPQMRVLLKVKIDDAITAYAIFTTLMGEEVEPRRDFIEKNALNALNIDF